MHRQRRKIIRTAWKTVILTLVVISRPIFSSTLPVTVETRRVVWLERFTQYVHWPKEHKVNQANASFVLCISHSPAFFSLVEALLAPRKIRNKSVTLLQLSAKELDARCDVIFLGPLDPTEVKDWVKFANKHHLLIISAQPKFASYGAHINMYEEEGLQKFEINHGEVQNAKLQIDARLLQMGRIVQTEEDL